uniref:Retrovirus-related Pol polyprotein from transposon TNT 1-94 n=1 Tax=Tanacetum cinerariifolium TaxID=118510 RepID=A0A6L2MEJ7_TANCI|nr:retrovirus-related Pol polyprotein from transposon TNT 1-94 [Tanacetum cinerariifolium]
MTLEVHNWSSSAHKEVHRIISHKIAPIVNQVDARVQNFEIQFLQEAAKFVREFKSLAKEADESLDKQKSLELEIERLLKASVSHDIMSIVQNSFVNAPSYLRTELDQYKYDKNSYDKAYKDMQQKVERLQAQFRDLNGLVHTTRTRRPQPKGKTRNAMVPSASKSSKVKKTVMVEEHRRTLLLSKNQKTMSSECNNIKLAIRNDKSKIVYANCNRSTNLYTINLYDMASASPICLMARATPTKSWLWHQRLSHLNFDTINDLAKNDLVSGLPKFKYDKEHLCPSCEQGKSKRASHPPKPVLNSKQRLNLLHMDLCGPMRVASINGKRYVLVIVDDYSRYTWVHFLIPDIVHATYVCPRYQAHPTEKHLKEVKRIFRYLWGTVNIDTFKNISGGAQFLGKKLVSWSSKKQDCTSLSTVESKYVSLSA